MSRRKDSEIVLEAIHLLMNRQSRSLAGLCGLFMFNKYAVNWDENKRYHALLQEQFKYEYGFTPMHTYYWWKYSTEGYGVLIEPGTRRCTRIQFLRRLYIRCLNREANNV